MINLDAEGLLLLRNANIISDYGVRILLQQYFDVHYYNLLGNTPQQNEVTTNGK